MGAAGRKRALQTRRVRRVLAAFRSPLTAFAVAFALVVQLIAMPYQQALAEPVSAGADTAAIAAGLKAVFGEAAGFCAQMDDKGAPTPHGPCNHCDDLCPLCRLVPGAAAFLPPDAPALPAPLSGPRHAIGSAPEFGAFCACPAQHNQARAPPRDV